MTTDVNRLTGPGRSWTDLLLREILPLTACLVVGMIVAGLAIRHAPDLLAAVHAAVETVTRVNHEAWTRIGWTWAVLGPMSLWLAALFLAICCRAAALTTPRRSLSGQLETIREVAPMIGMLGTISGLAAATRSMNADNVQQSLLHLAPAVGHALFSTMAGLGLAIGAYVLGRLGDSHGGAARRTIVMVVLASALGPVAPPRAAAAENLYDLPTVVGQTWDRVVASHRNPRPPVVQDRESVRRLIQRIARREGVDPFFAEALARSESDLNPYAVSPNGCCRGLFQLHHATARELGVENVFDATENATGGIRYFRSLAMRFGSVAVALVAYNAGPTVARRWMANPTATDVPPETVRFVDRVIATYRRLRESPRAGAGR